MSETKFTIESLEVFKLSEDFSNTIWSIVLRWKPFERETIG